MFNPLRAGAALRGRIEEVHPETADAATIVIRPGADWAGHVPGQYVRIGIDVDGVRLWRAYSLTHGPRADGRISITVKAVPEGKVSNHLVRDAPPGTLVHLEQAAGEFVLPTAGGKFLFVTAGSGITPVIGMLRNLFPVAETGVVRLERSAPSTSPSSTSPPASPHSIFIRNLRELDEAGMIRLVARYDDEHGVLDVEDLADAGARPGRAHHLRVRSGGAARRARAAPRRARAGAAHRAVPGRHAVTGEGGTVAFTATAPRSRPTGDRPILDQAEEAGVLMPSGCRMGICYGCVLPLREGTVRDLRTGEITSAAEGDGVKVQTCINAAAGSCEFDH